jgi:hypothetical protein
MSLPNLKDSICAVLVQGLKEINRAVISHQDKKEGFYEMIIDGNDLGGVLATRGKNLKMVAETCLQKTGLETGFLGQNLDRLRGRFFWPEFQTGKHDRA